MGKVAVVTGGSRGLGKAAVLALAKRGVDTIFTYHRNATAAHAVVAQVQALGAKAQALHLDVSKPETLDDFVITLHTALREWNVSTFDFLVNNAGIGSYSTAADTSVELLDTMYAIHLKSVFLLVQKTLDTITDGGRILNVSTGLTRFVGPGHIAYACIKGAIEVYTRYLAQELGPRKITVNVIAPGATATDFNGGAVRDNEVYNKAVSNAVALGRPGQAEEIGDAIACLLADECRWINGERVEVSGGQRL